MFHILLRDKFFLGALILLGLFLRLHPLLVTNWSIDSDEAIVGLMGKHILEGRPVPVFYYGQHYMGSLEAICAAILFKLFGISSITLKSVPLLFSLALLPLTYLLAFACGRGASQNSLNSLLVARVATFFIALPPVFLVEWSSKARGGFMEVIFLGLFAQVFLLYKLQTLRNVFVIGVILGVGWWTNNQILFYMLAIGGVILLRLARGPLAKIILTFVSGVGGFLLGGFPYWIYNVMKEFPSLSMFSSSGSKGFFNQLNRAFTESFPILFGVRRAWGETEIFAGGSLLLLALTLPIFLKAVSRLSEGLILQLLMVFGTLMTFALSSFGNLTAAPRYLLPLYPALYIILAVGVIAYRSLILRVSLTCGIIILSVISSYWSGSIQIAGEPFVFKGDRVARNQGDLLKWLLKENITKVRTNYWIGYRLTFESLEKITFIQFGLPRQIRIPEYEEVNRDRDLIPFVLTRSHVARVREALKLLNLNFQEEKVGGYYVLYNLNRKKFPAVRVIQPKKCVATFSAKEANGACDNDSNTRWGSGVAQRIGMKFRILFPKLQFVHGIMLDYGLWNSDFARGLKVSCIVGPASGRRELFSELSYRQVLNFVHELHEAHKFTVYFENTMPCVGIELESTRSHPIFDWSLAEVSALGE